MIYMRHVQRLQRFQWRPGIVLLALAQTLAISAFAQNNSGNAVKGFDEGPYSLLDIGDFIGWQWYQIGESAQNRPNKLNDGIFAGGRLTENVWNYVSLEQDFSLGNNTANLLPYGNSAYAVMGQHDYALSQIVDFYARPRDAKWRPYVFAGFGYTWYEPVGGINNITPPSTGPYVAPVLIGSTKGPAIFYGVGVKYNFSKRVDFRIDVTG